MLLAEITAAGQFADAATAGSVGKKCGRVESPQARRQEDVEMGRKKYNKRARFSSWLAEQFPDSPDAQRDAHMDKKMKDRRGRRPSRPAGGK